jgi:hypothetical protein
MYRLTHFVGLIVFAGCLADQTNSTLRDDREDYVQEHISMQFVEALVASDFEGAWNYLSPKLKRTMTVEQLQAQWRDITSGMSSELEIVDSNIGVLPDTPEQYGLSTDVSKADWVAWEFVTFGSEQKVLELWALVVKNGSAEVIEHFEVGAPD